MTDIERAVREIVDGPTPPPPPEPIDDRDDDDRQHIHIECPTIAVWSDGSTSTQGLGGTLLVAWFHIASAVTIALALWLLWSGLASVGVVEVVALSVWSLIWVALFLLLGAITAAVSEWWTRRRLRRRAAAADAAVQP